MLNDLEQLADQYPDYKMWLSEHGELVCATRRRRMTDAEWYGRSWQTLIENDVPTLAAKLAEQAGTT